MSLITLTDGTTIAVDCNIRQVSIGSTDPSIYDVKKDLLSSVKRRDEIPYLDVFILTHGDYDHCRGYKDNFYQGNPESYSSADKKASKVMIDEMWFSPMIAEAHTNNDEDAYQQEAERRLELHRKKDPNRDRPGNRIKIVGYDGTKKYADLDHLRATPGTIVSTFNNVVQATFSVFIHAPFKEHLNSAEKDKNSTSIVFQARFKTTAEAKEFCGFALFGGDSDHYSWEIILDKTRKHKNDVQHKALDWDLFLAPHHCSWSFFNDTPQSENDEPRDTSLKLLDYRRAGAKVIASSKEILNNDDNPPHYEAKVEYVSKVGSLNFLNTAIEPSKKQPLPIVFEITASGVKRIDAGEKADVLRGLAQGIAAGTMGTTKSGKVATTSESVTSHQSHRFYGEE